jgi:molecular chaperone GrpE
VGVINWNEKNPKHEVGGDAEANGEPQGSAEEAGKSEAEIGKLAADLEELRQTLLRRQADFDNYRKRVERERADDSKRTTGRLIEALLPILDNFEQALAAHREPEYAGYQKGFELIHKQLLDSITKLGAERVEPIGKPFDPHAHQAMDRTETSEYPDGTILQVFQPGWLFHGRVLRPAMVRVAVQPVRASKEAAN